MLVDARRILLPALALIALSAPLAVQADAPEGHDLDLRFEEVVLGEDHACARQAKGTVACWGLGDRGQLGPGVTGRRDTPTPVEGLEGVASLASGPQATCARLRAGGVRCWGTGPQVPSDGTGEPAPVPGITGPTKGLAVGATHACAVGVDGTVSCWGDNLYGQLGTPDLRTSPVPLPVPGLPPATAVAAGYGHTCALLTTGQVWCWGDGSQGQLGRVLGTAPSDGTDAAGPAAAPPPGDADPRGVPAAVDAELPPIRGLAARGNRTCAVTGEGVHCWGSHALDDPPQPVPEAVVTRKGLVAVSVGWSHGCALAGGGRAVCWGDDTHGELGARTAPSGVVVGAYGLTGVTSVAAGREESCATRDGARATCWGRFTPDEIAAARQETSAVEAPVTRDRLERQLPQGTRLLVRIDEALGPDGPVPKVVVRTLADHPCANTRLKAEVTTKRRQFRMVLGEPYLPDGECIASPAPAVASATLPPELSGRVDLVLRWDGQSRAKDFYQIIVGPKRFDALPMGQTFSAWEGPETTWRIPDGSLAISCTDHFDHPVCERRARDGLPTCRDVVSTDAIASAPQLKERDYANRWFFADPTALLVSPDFDHDAYERMVRKGFEDGSRCMDLRVRTWQGELWTNQPR